MHCMRCGRETDEIPCSGCGDEPRLNGHYRLDVVVGHGAHGTTWRAIDETTGQVRAIKELPLRRGTPGKTLELFKREAQVLQQLEHERLPRCYEAFETGSGRSHTLWIVMDFIEGQTLADELKSHRYGVDEVLDIVEDLLDTIHWLHTRSPPIVHRDLKPGNVIRNPDGRLTLVDFGSVRDALRDSDLGGSTVAGTFGFMAPEQFAGDARPQTDLYGLGATAIALLTRKAPHTLQDSHGRLQWREAAAPPGPIGDWLDTMIALDMADRPSDALAALRSLRAARAGESPQPSSKSGLVPVIPPAFFEEPTDAGAVEPELVIRQGPSGARASLTFLGTSALAMDRSADMNARDAIEHSLGLDGFWSRSGDSASWRSSSTSGRSVNIRFDAIDGQTRIRVSENTQGVWGGLIGGMGGGIGGGVGGGVGWLVFANSGPLAGCIFVASVVLGALAMGFALAIRIQNQRAAQLQALLTRLELRLGGAAVSRTPRPARSHWAPIIAAALLCAVAIAMFLPAVGLGGPGVWPALGGAVLLFGLGGRTSVAPQPSHRAIRREQRKALEDASHPVERDVTRATQQVEQTVGSGPKPKG